MKIKALTCFAGAVSMITGQVLECSDEVANDLITAGYAELVEIAPVQIEKPDIEPKNPDVQGEKPDIEPQKAKKKTAKKVAEDENKGIE